MTHQRHSVIPLIVVAALSTGCTNGPAAAATAGVQQGPPAPAPSDVPSTPSRATGTVAEILNAGGYTYLRLRTDNGDLWMAATQLPVKIGERLTAVLEMPMANFHSKTLNRDFPLIYFVSQVAREGETLLPAAPGPSMAGHETSAASPPAVERVVQPAGGISIADIWGRRMALANTTVTTRGRVVKVNTGIMGRNWVHLQDGSGSAADGTNDLVVTTDATLTPGDIVTVSGRLTVDADLGSGYAFTVLLEQAVVSR